MGVSKAELQRQPKAEEPHRIWKEAKRRHTSPFSHWRENEIKLETKIKIKS
jgi:hypothetical protein